MLPLLAASSFQCASQFDVNFYVIFLIHEGNPFLGLRSTAAKDKRIGDCTGSDDGVMGFKRQMPAANGSFKCRRVNVKSVEEIVFDHTAREDFLTGFHKRKLERARHAQEVAAKKERAQKIKARRLVGKAGL